MIEDLMKLKKQIDTMIETYKDLHPDDYKLMDNGEYVTELEAREKYEKQRGLKRIREEYYENKFSESKGKKTSRSSKGSSTLCVYGDS